MLQTDHPRRLHRFIRLRLRPLMVVRWLVAGRLRGVGAGGELVGRWLDRECGASGGILCMLSRAQTWVDHVILFARMGYWVKVTKKGGIVLNSRKYVELLSSLGS
jgi:hypothetical protein